jgi:hypothetical protein
MDEGYPVVKWALENSGPRPGRGRGVFYGEAWEAASRDEKSGCAALSRRHECLPPASGDVGKAVRQIEGQFPFLRCARSRGIVAVADMHRTSAHA